MYWKKKNPAISPFLFSTLKKQTNPISPFIFDMSSAMAFIMDESNFVILKLIERFIVVCLITLYQTIKF